MIPPEDFLRVAIEPAERFLTNIMSRDMGGDPARVMLLAIAMQESGLEHRRQIDSAGMPMDSLARGWFQFEAGGGVHGVCTHAASKDAAAAACARLHVPFVEDDIHESLAWHDQLAVAFARLLLYTDPAPLPPVGAEQEAWDYYLRLWRPGKPHRDRWTRYYPMAVATVAAATAAPAALPFIVPKPGTLTATTTSGRGVQIDLPVMIRSWQTGSFWLAASSTAIYGLVLLAPIIEPQMDRLEGSQWLAALPLGLGPIVYAVAREWYKAQRVKFASEVAAAAAKNQP